MRKGKKRCKKCRMRRCKMDTLLHRHFYTQTLVRRHAFTHRGVYTQTLLHTEVLTHRRLDTTKLAQSTGNVLPSATSYCKACTSTSRYYSFAQNTSPYYFVLQRLHTVLPSTTPYKRTTKLAQRCTKYFPVLLCTTKLAQSTSLRSGHPPSSYTQTTDAFTQETPLHTNAFTHRHFSTHFYAQKACRKCVLYCFVLQSIKAYTGGERKLKLCCQNAPRDKKNAEENLGLCWRNARNKKNRDENHIMLVKRVARILRRKPHIMLPGPPPTHLGRTKNHKFSSVFDNRTTFHRSNCRIFVIACDHRSALRENRN